MKNSYKIPVLIFLLIQIFNYTLSADISSAQWVQSNGPYGGSIECLTVLNTDLYAGLADTGPGIFKSTNLGENWIKVNSGLTNQNICLLYTSPSPRDSTRSRMPSSA